MLLEQGIITEELAESLKKMAQFRNVIVYDYIRIQPEIVYGVLQKNLVDIIAFAMVIKERYLPSEK